MIVQKEIQERLAKAILESGIKQTILANQLGIRQQQISSYIHGKTLPNLETLANLCIIIEIEPNEILGYTKKNW